MSLRGTKQSRTMHIRSAEHEIASCNDMVGLLWVETESFPFLNFDFLILT
jgi:hypothetical protein